MSRTKTLTPIPRGIRMLVDRDTVSEKTTEAGIIIEERQQKQPVTGTVTAVGSLVSDYKVGDRVIFAAFAGHSFEFEEKSFLLLKDSDILCSIG